MSTAPVLDAWDTMSVEQNTLTDFTTISASDEIPSKLKDARTPALVFSHSESLPQPQKSTVNK